MQKIKSVVIDDELSNRHLIKQLILDLNPNFEVLGEADSVQSGYQLINSIKPQLVFLDIRMPDGTGFELLDKFIQINFDVVFISAFDQYALKAFEINALDYILKPIDPHKFSNTLEKIHLKISTKTFDMGDLKKVLASYDSKKLVLTKIPIHVGNKVILLNVQDLLYVITWEGYTKFRTLSNENILSSKQLIDFEFILETIPAIIKINKSTYINLNYMQHYTKGRDCIVTMTDGNEFEISRRKKGEILEVLAAGRYNSRD